MELSGFVLCLFRSATGGLRVAKGEVETTGSTSDALCALSPKRSGLGRQKPK